MREEVKAAAPQPTPTPVTTVMLKPRKRLRSTITLITICTILGGGLLLTPGDRAVPPSPATVAPVAPVAPEPASPGAAEAAMVYRPPVFHNSQKSRTPHVWRTWEPIGGVGVNVVYVNMEAAHTRLVPGFAPTADPVRGYFPRVDFHRIVKHYAPRVAINGTYFHLLNGQPTGPIFRHGQLLFDGRWGTTISTDDRGCITFRYQSGTYGRHRGWEGVYNAICTGPTLVRDGKLWLHPGREGFHDPAVLNPARRSALGITADGRLLLVTVHTPISLNKLAHVMMRLDCQEAANLDGGSSSALYCNGEFVTKPNRRLSNVLLVYD